MHETYKISSVSKNGSSLLVDWNDGKKSTYNFLWLRDNCPSEIHPTANERTFNLLTVTENIHPKSYEINSEGMLEIEWSEGNHTSYYEPNWLRNNCYTIKNKQQYLSPYKLWNHSLQNDLNIIKEDNCCMLTGSARLADGVDKANFAAAISG